MGGKPRKAPVLNTKCVCGHKKSLHHKGERCTYLAEWKNPDSTWVSTTVCICQKYRSQTKKEETNAETREEAPQSGVHIDVPE